MTKAHRSIPADEVTAAFSPGRKARIAARAAELIDEELARAEEALTVRRVFSLPPSEWKKFQAALDATPRALPRLKRLLREPGVFDHSPKK